MTKIRNPLPAVRLLILGFGLLFVMAACSSTPAVEPTPTQLPPELAEGHAVYRQKCAICHAITPDTVVRGPSLHGIATLGSQRVEGMNASDYIYTSILIPDDYLVEGFENIMPANLGKDLTGEELDAVVNFLLTLE